MSNKEKTKHIGLRVDDDLHAKLKDLAEYEGRSINGEIIYLVRQAVLSFEKEHNDVKSKQ